MIAPRWRGSDRRCPAGDRARGVPPPSRTNPPQPADGGTRITTGSRPRVHDKFRRRRGAPRRSRSRDRRPSHRLNLCPSRCGPHRRPPRWRRASVICVVSKHASGPDGKRGSPGRTGRGLAEPKNDARVRAIHVGGEPVGRVREVSAKYRVRRREGRDSIELAGGSLTPSSREDEIPYTPALR